MPDSDDKTYYAARAKAARTLAEAAADPVVREIHLRMADSYEQLAATSAPLKLTPPPGA